MNQQQMEEIVATYLSMLEQVNFDKSWCKFNDCAICLKEFESGEELKQIPSCEHVFHEQCLREWFKQL